MKKRKARYLIRPELIIIGLIIACAVMMLSYEANSRMRGMLILGDDGKIFLCHNKEHSKGNAEHDNAHILWEFEADTCRFIEVLDEDLTTVFRMIYADIPVENDPLAAYTDNLNLNVPYNQKQKVTVNTADGDVADVYYIWTTHSGDEKTYLLVQSVSHGAMQELNTFNLTCYVMIALCFLLAVVMVYWQCIGIANQYKRIKQALEDDTYSLY